MSAELSPSLDLPPIVASLGGPGRGQYDSATRVRAPLCPHRVPASEPLRPSDRALSASHQLHHIKSEFSASVLVKVHYPSNLPGPTPLKC